MSTAYLYLIAILVPIVALLGDFLYQGWASLSKWNNFIQFLFWCLKLNDMAHVCVISGFRDGSTRTITKLFRKSTGTSQRRLVRVYWRLGISWHLKRKGGMPLPCSQGKGRSTRVSPSTHPGTSHFLPHSRAWPHHRNLGMSFDEPAWNQRRDRNHLDPVSISSCTQKQIHN